MRIEIYFLSPYKILNGQVSSFDAGMIRLIPAILEITRPTEPIRPYSVPEAPIEFDAHITIHLTGEELINSVSSDNKHGIFKLENRTFRISWEFDINDIIPDLNYAVRIPITSECKASDLCHIKLN